MQYQNGATKNNGNGKIFKKEEYKKTWEGNVVCVVHIKMKQNLDIWKSKTDITVIAKTVKNYTTRNIREFIEKGKEDDRSKRICEDKK
jgi:hypothetical protein